MNLTQFPECRVPCHPAVDFLFSHLLHIVATSTFKFARATCRKTTLYHIDKHTDIPVVELELTKLVEGIKVWLAIIIEYLRLYNGPFISFQAIG